MTRALLISPSYFLLLIFLIFSYTTFGVSGEEYEYVKRVNPQKMKMLKPKTSHFRLYWHDIVTGSNATSVSVVKAVSNSSTYFGMINIIDNLLTTGPNLSSKTVGRAEGLYASTGQEETSLLMAMNFAFSDGKYNGSTITILGRNNVPAEVREMPIVGGSGLFRFARGYVKATSYELSSNGNAIVEYNAYVIHY